MIAAAPSALKGLVHVARDVFEGSFEGNKLGGPRHDPNFGNCPVINLPAGGHIKLNESHVLKLHQNATYMPNCSDFLRGMDPFYGSTTVFVFVVGIATVIAWVLLILLLINQSDSRIGRAPKTTGWFQSRAVPSAIAGNTPLGGLGNRPWLQKAAVLLVAVGLTVASADTIQNAEMQHQLGWNSARWMRNAVVRTYEVRILRVVSTVFVWLALVQTLLRLFPRRKEKLIIKWFGFALILLDTVFSCLNSFLNPQETTGSSQDAISALAYLFQLSINLLYAAWVSYYMVTQRRFAFFRPDQLNMSIVAILAMMSMAIPVAFFIADIAVPPVSGWGDFFLWVGGAAASVVVWEWVERIEALEREEKKDGILGREVFDEDEMPTSRSSTDDSGSGSGSYGSSGDSLDEKKTRSQVLPSVTRPSAWKSYIRRRGREAKADLTPPESDLEKQAKPNGLANTRQDSSLSRGGTASPGSTIYAVHYHPVQFTPPAPETEDTNDAHDENAAPKTLVGIQTVKINDSTTKDGAVSPTSPAPAKPKSKTRSGWTLATGVFKKRKHSPPLEIKKAMQRSGIPPGQFRASPRRFSLRSRTHGSGAGKGDAAISNDKNLGESNKQPTIIPAPPRGQTWSPDILRHSPVHRFQNTTQSFIPTSHAHPALARRTPVDHNGEVLATHQDTAQDEQAPAADYAEPNQTPQEDTPYDQPARQIDTQHPTDTIAEAPNPPNLPNLDHTVEATDRPPSPFNDANPNSD